MTLKAQNVTPMFGAKDSMIVEVNQEGQLIYHYKFKKENTLYSLSRTFGVPVANLMQFNHITEPSAISLDEDILIPISQNRLSSPKNLSTQDVVIPVYYNVKPKETLFRIARIYTDKTIDELVEWNHLENHVLSKNQKLLIGYFVLNTPQNIQKIEDSNEQQPVLVNHHFDEDIKIQPTIDSLEVTDEIKQYHFKTAYEKGPAYWNKSQKNNGLKFILFDKAVPNSMVEIYNPNTNRTVMAKVLGGIPKDAYQNNINCIVSPQVAKELGELNARFYTEIKYQVLVDKS
ncbi:MAG TPA: LysM peptidoglycan-binding domain-containing protein [Saprospiraceae bacterium]|nr:LysM peptidoglycan-binding domain-containing protein [Saprospiraceae bacterium]